MKLSKTIQKGFTLIELLVVIAVLGVLAAAVVAAINPATKVNQAKDATVKSDIGQIANAMQAYFTNSGISGSTPYYPAEVTALVPSELNSVPATATTLAKSPVGCTTANKDCTAISVSAPLNNSADLWCWKSSTGVVAAAATCTP